VAPRAAAPSWSARGLADPAEQVALVARAKRGALLRAHRHEDLGECFSQATLELLAAVRAGRRLSGAAHLANALEQRFLSRVRDRRRAVGGRSSLQAALEDALPLGGFGEREVEICDPRADVHQLVVRRMDLERLLAVAPGLSSDQRLVLRHQIRGGSRAEFCRRYGWSFEKYRKVAQRGRARLGALMEQESRGAGGGAGPRRVVTPLAPATSPFGGTGRSRG
jgi:DNA-directed RNA polymerase specialized sigma24 family protein